MPPYNFLKSVFFNNFSDCLLINRVIFKLLNHKKQVNMKKVFFLATAALLITGVTFAEKGKKKKCAKAKKCCAHPTPGCNKSKAKTAEM